MCTVQVHGEICIQMKKNRGKLRAANYSINETFVTLMGVFFKHSETRLNAYNCQNVVFF